MEAPPTGRSSRRIPPESFLRRRLFLQLFADNLPNDLKQGTLPQILGKRVVDQGLVVASSSLIGKLAEGFDHGVVQTDGDLGLTGLGLHHRPSLGLRKINVPIGFSGGFFHTLTLKPRQS